MMCPSSLSSSRAGCRSLLQSNILLDFLFEESNFHDWFNPDLDGTEVSTRRKYPEQDIYDNSGNPLGCQEIVGGHNVFMIDRREKPKLQRKIILNKKLRNIIALQRNISELENLKTASGMYRPMWRCP